MRLLLQKLNHSGFEAFEKHHEAATSLCARRCQPRIRLFNQAGMERPATHSIHGSWLVVSLLCDRMCKCHGDAMRKLLPELGQPPSRCTHAPVIIWGGAVAQQAKPRRHAAARACGGDCVAQQRALRRREGLLLGTGCIVHHHLRVRVQQEDRLPTVEDGELFD